MCALLSGLYIEGDHKGGGGGGVSPKKEKNVSLRPHKQYSVRLSSKIPVETKRKTPVSVSIR